MDELPIRTSDSPLARRRRLAWIVAISADVVQYLAMPLFAGGWVSPFDIALEIVVSVVLFRLLGWHPALLPAIVLELVPGLDLVPTWTAAVFLATRGAAPRASDVRRA